MKGVVEDLVEVLRKHGYNIEIDSAMIELGSRGEIFFRCKDIDRENFELRKIERIIDKIRLY